MSTQEPATLRGLHNPQMQPPQIQHRQLPAEQLQQQQQQHSPSLPLANPGSGHSPSLQLVLHSSSSQVNPRWCDLCQVPCMNDLNYEQHCQGKKHKFKWEEALGNSKELEMKRHKLLWCNKCAVPCVNELALSQHLAGKKHAHRLVELQPNAGCQPACLPTMNSVQRK